MKDLELLFARINEDLDLLPVLKAAVDEMTLQARFLRLKQPLRPDANEATETM